MIPPMKNRMTPRTQWKQANHRTLQGFTYVQRANVWTSAKLRRTRNNFCAIGKVNKCLPNAPIFEPKSVEELAVSPSLHSQWILPARNSFVSVFSNNYNQPLIKSEKVLLLPVYRKDNDNVRDDNLHLKKSHMTTRSILEIFQKCGIYLNRVDVKNAVYKTRELKSWWLPCDGSSLLHAINRIIFKLEHYLKGC